MNVKLAIISSFALFSVAAHAYVRSETDSGTPVYWDGDCTYLTPDSAPFPDLPAAQVLATIQTSINDWQSVTLGAGCSYLRLQLDPTDSVEAHLDYKNVIKFRQDKWCRPAETNHVEMCFSAQAAAITTVFYNAAPGKAGDGQIVDADIELNAIDYTFANLPSNVTPRNGTQVADLENTLTHELGHFQGLDHTCWDPSAEMRQPLDNGGNPVPACADVLAHRVSTDEYNLITTATMFAYAQPGETSKRMPKADDIQAICEIYAKAHDPKTCTRAAAPHTGCQVGRGQSATGALGLLAMIGLLAQWTKKRRTAL
jgi:hypothetical protein